ncbi:MAG: flagellar basal body rod protein FlgC [Pseudomonadota bacterium]
MDLYHSINIAASGMKAQGTRLRIVAENLANADSIGDNPNQAPFRRQLTIFADEHDKAMDANRVIVKKITEDPSEFRREYQPNHPAADAQGFVRLPNVHTLIELMDMREASRSYEANVNVMENSRAMLTRTIDMLR